MEYQKWNTFWLSTLENSTCKRVEKCRLQAQNITSRLSLKWYFFHKISWLITYSEWMYLQIAVLYVISLSYFVPWTVNSLIICTMLYCFLQFYVLLWNSNMHTTFIIVWSEKNNLSESTKCKIWIENFNPECIPLPQANYFLAA